MSIAQLQDRFHLYKPQDYRPLASASYVSNMFPQTVITQRRSNEKLYEITAFVLGYKDVLKAPHVLGDIRQDPELDHVRQYLSRHMAWYSVYQTYLSCDNVLLYTSEGRHDAITYIIGEVLHTNTHATTGLLLGYPEEDVRFFLYRIYVMYVMDHSKDIFKDLGVGQQGKATDITRRKPTDLADLSWEDYEKIREHEPAKTYVENAMTHAKDQIESYRQYTTSDLVQWMRDNTREYFTFDQFIVQPDIAGILHDLYHALDYCARYIS